MPPRTKTKTVAARTRPAAQWVGAHSQSAGPQLGEVRVHRKNGLTYIYEVVPNKERLGWLRHDTWLWGAWARFPNKLANVRDLRRFDRARLDLSGDEPVTFLHCRFE